MRLLPLVLAATFAAAVPVAASAQTPADNMLESARKLRATVDQQGANLPPDVRAMMMKQAEELERQAENPAFAKAPAAPPKEPGMAEKLMAQHGRLDWLAPKAACRGYTLENYGTFRFSPGINDRDSHCRNAYGHYAEYLRVTRNNLDPQFADQSLYYYDAAARRAVGLMGNN